MGYEKVDWTTAKITAANLNRGEQGIKDAHDFIDNLTGESVPIVDAENHFAASTVEGALHEMFNDLAVGKGAIEASIISKEGTVTKAGPIATMAELDAGVQSIEIDPLATLVAGDQIRLAGPSRYASNDTDSWVRLHRVYVYRSGSVRLRMTVHGTPYMDANGLVEIRVGGVAVAQLIAFGEEGDYAEYSTRVDVNVTAGDQITIWGKRDDGNSWAGVGDLEVWVGGFNTAGITSSITTY